MRQGVVIHKRGSNSSKETDSKHFEIANTFLGRDRDLDAKVMRNHPCCVAKLGRLVMHLQLEGEFLLNKLAAANMNMDSQ